MASLIVVTLIIMTTQLLLHVNVLTQSGQALTAFLKLALTLIPGMTLIALPFALILGTSNTLNRMNNDSELAVLEASGAGRAFVVKPILFLAVAFTVISLFIAQIVEPWANRQRRDLLVSASSDLIQIAIQSGTFWPLEANLHVQVEERFPGGDLGGIFLADRRDEGTEFLYYATRGTVTKHGDRNLIVMSDGEIHRRDMVTGDVSIIKFASYALDMTQFGPVRGQSRYYPKERSLAELLKPDPDDRLAKNRPQLLRSEIHRRFSEWLYPLAFALIAIYVAGTARANRQERVWSMAAAFGIAFTIRGLGFTLINNAGNSLIVAAACYVLPLGTISVISLLLITGHVIAVPQKLLDRSASIVAMLDRKRQTFQKRMSGYRDKSEETA